MAQQITGDKVENLHGKKPGRNVCEKEATLPN